MLKLLVWSKDNHVLERISPWAHYVIQNPDTKLMEPYLWNPETPYKHKYPVPAKPTSLRIYESHVGISSDEYKVASYKHFQMNVLSHIKELG